MRIILRGHNYRYAAEQMLVTLFPKEKLSYDGEEENSVCLSLCHSPSWVTASAVLHWQGRIARRSCRIRATRLTGNQQEDDRLCQESIKRAFYRAGTDLLGKDLPWGSCTGVRPVKIPTKMLAEGFTDDKARSELCRVYRVSPKRAELALDCARVSLDIDHLLLPEDICLYVGIPFCPTRCSYCSFVSADVRRALQLTQPYTDSLIQEIAAAGTAVRNGKRRIRAVYFGGGTPTTLTTEQLDQVLTALEKHFSLDSCLEYTVEAGRPDTITQDKLQILAEHGVARLSVNPQTMENSVLRAMGRQHTAEQVEQAYASVREFGVFTVNMDLIAGLPTDTPTGFHRSLDCVMGLDPENITIHTLALKRGSFLKGQGEQLLPGESAVEDMLSYAWEHLNRAGYKPYYLYRQKFMTGSFENVGWYIRNLVNIYNVCMMEELRSVLSLGAGGVTKLIDRKNGSVIRKSNPKYPQDYLSRIQQICQEKKDLLWPDIH